MGPFLPVIYEACQEDQLAEEYQHGVTSFGAFTYCVTQTLRDARNSGKEFSFQELLDRTSKRLDDMGYIQKPAILGPEPISVVYIKSVAAGTPPAARMIGIPQK